MAITINNVTNWQATALDRIKRIVGEKGWSTAAPTRRGVLSS